jgi:prepilin-type N-terminal cleavage/methylation domain-containing protein
VRRARHGFTLLEVGLVLAILAIATALAVPAVTRLGVDKPATNADALLGLLHDSRKEAIDRNVTATLLLDPLTGRFQLDTTGLSGSGTRASGSIQLGINATLSTDLARLRYTFRPTGAASGDTVLVRGGSRTMLVSVDPWSGVARADAR